MGAVESLKETAAKDAAGASGWSDQWCELHQVDSNGAISWLCHVLSRAVVMLP